MKLLLRSTLLVLVFYFGVPFWSNAEEPVSTYSETTWCGGVQMVTLKADGSYDVQRLGDCPTLRIDGSPAFQARTYELLEELHQSQPEVTDRLLAITWQIVEGLPYGGIAPGYPKGAIFFSLRLCDGIGGDAWCKSILAHEMLHLEQFLQGRAWCGWAAEREANDYQANVLEQLIAGDTGWQWPWLVGFLDINHAEYPGYPSCK